MGNRLQAHHPKALLTIGGKTLLSRHLENLHALAVPLRVVTGWHADMLAAHLTGATHAPDIELVHNPAFQRGSLLSMQCGLAGVDDDVLLMDADVLYDPTILRDVAALPRGFAVDPRTDPGNEEMMIGVRDGEARAIRRGALDGFDLVGEGVGFFKIDRASLPAIREAMAGSDPDGDYESAIDRFLDAHGASYVDVAGRKWTEIDFPEDLDHAQTLGL